MGGTSYFVEEKLLGISKSKLKGIFRKSISKIPKGTETSKPFRAPEFFELDRIKKFDNVCHSRIVKLIEEENLRRRKIQSEKILENWEEEENSYNAFRDIISYSDSKDIFTKIKELSKDREFLQSIESDIKEYYHTSNAGDFHSQDVPKLKSILSKMKKEKWTELDLIDKYFMKHLRNRIKISIEHLIKTNSKVK